MDVGGHYLSWNNVVMQKPPAIYVDVFQNSLLILNSHRYLLEMGGVAIESFHHLWFVVHHRFECFVCRTENCNWPCQISR